MYWISFQCESLSCFYLQSYLCCTEPFKEKFYGFWKSCLGNNMQHMPVCANMISCWRRKVWSMAKTDMSLGTLQGAAASTALKFGVSLVPIFGPEFVLQLDTKFQHISLLQIWIRTLCSMLSWALVSSQLGKCQTLTDIMSCRFVGLLAHSSSQY